MKKQRWPGDYQTKEQEFASARTQEQMGMAQQNKDLKNDYLAMGDNNRLDEYQRDEMYPSWATQLDTVGMQPHAREYLERDMSGLVSERKFIKVDGQPIDYCAGIHFNGTP
jgi:hypothetical protein